MFDSHLERVEKPGRYIGLELNAYRKSFESASVRFALAFPDVYEIGLSHLGLQLLYHQLNQARRSNGGQGLCAVARLRRKTEERR